MVTAEEIIGKLNHALNAPDLNTDQFINNLNLLTEQEKAKVKIIDIEFYNEESLEHARKEMKVGIKTRNFEWAVRWREKELEILKYIELRQKLNIEKSAFHFDEGLLLYFHLGTAKNDPHIKELIKPTQKK
jgi:hypothetical protein